MTESIQRSMYPNEATVKRANAYSPAVLSRKCNKSQAPVIQSGENTSGTPCHCTFLQSIDSCRPIVISSLYNGKISKPYRT